MTHEGVLDAVVVGGGAMGSAAAWRLARRGAAVVLLEQFGPGHTRGASHGASRIFRLVYPEPVYIDLARRALPLWRELEAATGHVLLTVTGGVDHGDPAAITALDQATRAAGVPGELLSAAAAGERWPGLAFDDAGPVFFHPASGRLHADRSVMALQVSARAHGAEVRHNAVVRGIEVLGDDLVEVHTDAGALRARRVVVAAGAWSAKLLAGLVDLPPLRVTQEQPAHFAPTVAGEWPAFIHHGADGGVYGLATPGQGIKVGFHATGPERDPDATAPFDALQHKRLQRYVERWLPGVRHSQYTRISCTYTSTPTGDFVIDRAGPVVVAAGFSGHGFKFTPAVGELLADLAGPGLPAPRRFALAR
ncbi:N-methyl-L-tryptophan oxidase [Dactylosporangium sp. NPDC051541]|uniref:N-methyl-L-tryptophan oxidase n=1 Tax=Dactylosporangium sp. NPDC051541 TaxID=3363977 RepID=UPI00379B4E5F